jgi:hypothetical protein
MDIRLTQRYATTGLFHTPNELFMQHLTRVNELKLHMMLLVVCEASVIGTEQTWKETLDGTNNMYWFVPLHYST